MLQPVDDAVRRQAKALVRTARHAALACLEPGSGFPAISRVSVATDFDGRPLLLISGLSGHSKSLAVDPRCALLFGQPGKGDPLAHPRISVTGRARRVERDDPAMEVCRERFLARQPKAKLYVDFPDFVFIAVDVERASLNGGFGKAYDLEAADLIDAATAVEGLEASSRRARDHMNEDHLDAVETMLSAQRPDAEGWRILTVDRTGFEVGRGDALDRMDFSAPVGVGGYTYHAAFIDLVRAVNTPPASTD
ncbi:HugZ family protein [Mangrovicella endophytica]|uniref:HugZ family pyridoxamine 5'-phosphate oxidase n=1 Tax=Mangrovicella endophytica TaxID=2066697 RepID=UPI001FDFD759|nr:pyridoxamine 5'-phosphate oxidase family protein [Mangrovicella endophytica]